MSVITMYLLESSGSVINPVEIPATGSFIGTPAAINANVLPQILACDVEPFDSNTSDTNLIVYGNSSSDGNIGTRAFSANAPCPISRRPAPLDGFASPTEYDGKLY